MRLSGGPRARTRGPWVAVKPEWLSGLAEPSPLGGQTNLRFGVLRAWALGSLCFPGLAFFLAQHYPLPEDRAGMGSVP